MRECVYFGWCYVLNKLSYWWIKKRQNVKLLKVDIISSDWIVCRKDIDIKIGDDSIHIYSTVYCIYTFFSVWNQYCMSLSALQILHFPDSFCLPFLLLLCVWWLLANILVLYFNYLGFQAMMHQQWDQMQSGVSLAWCLLFSFTKCGCNLYNLIPT